MGDTTCEGHNLLILLVISKNSRGQRTALPKQAPRVPLLPGDSFTGRAQHSTEGSLCHVTSPFPSQLDVFRFVCSLLSWLLQLLNVSIHFN